MIIKGWEVFFDESRHAYSDSAGHVPGVSEIISATSGKKSYYAKDTTKRDRGTKIHDATALMDSLGLSLLDFDDLDIHPHLNAWNLWQLENSITMIHVERMVGYREFRYAGTLDRIVAKKKVLAVADLKTGAKQPWHKHQLAAYAVAFEWETGELPEEGIAVYTKDSGKYAQQVYAGDDWKLAILEWKERVRKYKEKTQ
jgi:hypothetical protein